MIRWLEGIGLKEYAGNLSGNGVHGAILILDCDFHADNLAGSMQIPIENVEVSLFVFLKTRNVQLLVNCLKLKGLSVGIFFFSKNFDRSKDQLYQI